MPARNNGRKRTLDIRRYDIPMPSPNTPSDGPRNPNTDDILRDVLKKTLQSNIGPDAFFQQLGMNANEVTLYNLYLQLYAIGTAPENNTDRESLGKTIKLMADGMDAERRTFIENLAKAALGIHYAEVEKELARLRQEFSAAMAKLRGEELKPTPTSPEPTPEAPSFSRYLKYILADPAAPEAVNLLAKFRSPNGRLWVDKKKADGSVIRIWFSLNLTPEEKSNPDVEFIAIIKGKLAPGGLRFRVDDLSAGKSWKEKWTTKKTGISALVAAAVTVPEAERPAACARIAEALFGTGEAAKPGGEAFTALLQQYLTRPDGKTDIWTHVRNAYWHADGWRDEADAESELGGLGVPPNSLKPPSYASAEIRVWQKIGEEPRAAQIEGKSAPLFYNGTKFAVDTIEKTVIANGPQKGAWYRIGSHCVREEYLRISLRQNPTLPAGETLSEGTFELMAWQAQTEEPKEPPTQTAPPATPPPATSPASPPGPKVPKPATTPSPPTASGEPKSSPKSPPVAPLPAVKKKGGTDATPPASPSTKPAESKESAEVLREREVIAIPDIHGEANALLTSLKVAGYIELKDAKWDEGWHLTEAGQKAHIVFTGDLLDRGSENIGVLEIVKKLRAEGARIEILAGNHEMILLNTLQSSHQADWLHWIGNGGGSVLKELGEHANISTNAVTILDILSYLPHMEKHKKNFAGMPPVTASCAELLSWWEKNSSKITQTINDPTDQSIRSTLEHTSITDTDIVAFGKLQERAKETFFVQYGEMVKSLNLMTIVDDVLYVHASLNEYWIDLLEREGIDGVNREFHTAIKDPKKLREMAGSTGKYGDVMWDRNLQANLKKRPELVQRLKQLGIRMIVHGHTETSCVQTHTTTDNLHIVNGDVSMYRRPGGAFVRVRGRRHKENGKVERFVGASRSPYDETGYKTLASLPPGKEKPAPTS